MIRSYDSKDRRCRYKNLYERENDENENSTMIETKTKATKTMKIKMKKNGKLKSEIQIYAILDLMQYFPY